MVNIANSSDHEDRWSVSYMDPERNPPYWMSLPRVLQARFAQLITGRAVTQDFMHLIRPTEHPAYCPLGDGIATLGHYVRRCKATWLWRQQLLEYWDVDTLPPLEELVNETPAPLLYLIDNSSLGTNSFLRTWRENITRPHLKFWKPPRKPLSQCHCWINDCHTSGKKFCAS